MGTYKYCLCFTRRFRWKEAQPPPDVKSAFSVFSDGGAHMNADNLRRFLAESQGEGAATVEEAELVLDQIRQLCHRRHIGKISRAPISLEDFHHYLFDAELNPPLRSQVHQDMTAPLSEYYIYTGHNSYLTGNQLSSDCSDVPIVKALQRSVRVIELDIWPNSTKDNIDVLHGGTLTSPVELIKCLRSIKEYAFSASPYPLVITLEDHLTPDLQAKVAKMVTETFGDMLYYPDSEHHKEFPSPESLKRRVILSTKPPKEYLEASKEKESDSQNGKDPNEEEAWGREVSDLEDEIESDDKDDESEVEDEEDDLKSRQNSAPEYKRLITIRAGKPKGSLKDSLKVDPDKVRRLSLSEHQLAKAVVTHGADIVRFSQRNMLRIYPKGTRVDSSNYNPLIGWMHGAQMVAFNMQVGIAGVHADSTMKKTKTIEDDWTPVWDEEFIFQLRVPELALLRVEVHEYDMSAKDDFGGQTCLPVWELRPGMRCVPLFDREGNKFKSIKLLMRFEFV